MSNKPDVNEIVGCTNHGCVFGHPGGMGTNSRCVCLDIHPDTKRRQVERNIRLLRAEIQRLRAAMHAMSEHRDWADFGGP